MKDYSRFNRRKTEVEKAIIANGTNESSIVNSLGRTLVGIRTPSALDSTKISFKTSIDSNSTLLDYYNVSSGKIEIQTPTSKHIGIEPIDFSGVNFFKIISDQNETADREFELIFLGI